MNGTLFKKEMKSNVKIFLIFAAIVTLYGSVIVAMYDPKLGESLNMMATAMPELFAAFGMVDPGLTLLDFILNYLYGFLLIVIPFVFSVILCHRLMARYIDQGSMAYLLAVPYNRNVLLRTQLFVLLVWNFLLIAYVSVLILGVSSLMFKEGIEVLSFLWVNLALFFLHVFLSSMCFLFACSFNETKFSIGLGAGLGGCFVLIQMLSKVSDTVDFLKYFTPLTLFDPKKLAAFDSNALCWAISLLLGSIVWMILASVIFKKRDLPL